MPTLVARCREGTLDAYVQIGRVLGDSAGGSPVRLRFGADAPTSELWIRSADFASVFAPDAAAFLRGPLADTDTFRIEARPFGAAPIVATFAPTGLRAYLSQMHIACPSYRLDAGAAVIDRRVAAFVAALARYDSVSVRPHRLGATLTTLASAERVVGSLCSVRVVRTTRGGGSGRVAVVLDFAELTPPAVTEHAASPRPYSTVTLRNAPGDEIELPLPSRPAADEVAAAAAALTRACN
jgi:hypothetical protein